MENQAVEGIVGNAVEAVQAVPEKVQASAAALKDMISSLTGMAVSMEWRAAAAALLFCMMIGIGFGSYPAAKASRMTPIDALQRR